MISHELRTPISAISASVEVLGNTRLDETQSRMVDLAKDSLAMVRSILDDILDYSKIEAGVMRINARATDIRSVVDHVCSVMRPFAKKKGLIIKSRVGRGVEKFHLADEIRLKQVVLNLVSNAVKFTNCGHVDVDVDCFEARYGCQGVVILVADTGVGISGDHMQSIFDPFFQAGEVEDKRQNGAGLGLNICRHLVSLMSGSLSCESKPGAGTVFRIELVLPVLNLDLESESNEKPIRGRRSVLPEGSGGNPKKVLIAGSGGTGRLLVELALEVMGVGYDVIDGVVGVPVGSVPEGYGLLVVNCDVPQGDEYALIQGASGREGVSASVPILFFLEGGMEGGEAGSDNLINVDFVAKPISFSSTNEILRFWLSGVASGSERAFGRAGLLQGQDSDHWIPDVDKLLEAYGSAVVVKRIMNNLVENSLADIELLRNAITNDDLAEVRRRLHRIAGSMAFVGYVPCIDSIYGLIQKVEACGVVACKNSILSSIGEIVHLVDCVSRVEQSLGVSGA